MFAELPAEVQPQPSAHIASSGKTRIIQVFVSNLFILHDPSTLLGSAPAIDEELPEIPLAFVPRYYTFHKKVRGFETDGDGRFNMTTAGFSRVWIAP